MMPFIFRDSSLTQASVGVAQVLVPSGIRSKDRLLEIIARGLQFPSYFGFNWDALSDALRDLEWLPESEVVLIHEDLPYGIGPDDVRAYLRVLARAVEDWKPGETHSVQVVFPSEYRQQIESLLM